MPSCYAFVNHLILFHPLLYSRVHELCHFNIISKQVQRKVTSFGNGHELFLIVIRICILSIFLVKVKRINFSRAFESRYWLNKFVKLWIIFQITNHQTTILFIEKLSEIKCMRNRWIVLQLMEKKSIIVTMQQPQKLVFVLMIFHIIQSCLMNRDVMRKNLRAFSHQKHREVIRILILPFKVI